MSTLDGGYAVEDALDALRMEIVRLRETRLEVTPADARLLRVLASLVAFLPPAKRAAHLAGECEALAHRIERAVRADGAA